MRTARREQTMSGTSSDERGAQEPCKTRASSDELARKWGSRLSSCGLARARSLPLSTPGQYARSNTDNHPDPGKSTAGESTAEARLQPQPVKSLRAADRPLHFSAAVGIHLPHISARCVIRLPTLYDNGNRRPYKAPKLKATCVNQFFSAGQSVALLPSHVFAYTEGRTVEVKT